MILFKKFGCFPTLVALLLMVIALVVMQGASARDFFLQENTAAIVDHTITEDSHGTTTLQVTYAFDHNQITYESTHVARINQMATDEFNRIRHQIENDGHIPIRFDPANPTHSYPDTGGLPYFRWIIAAFCWLLILIFLGAGYFMKKSNYDTEPIEIEL